MIDYDDIELIKNCIKKYYADFVKNDVNASEFDCIKDYMDEGSRLCWKMDELKEQKNEIN